MNLWLQWFTVLWQLRPACSHLRSFLWFCTCVAGVTIRTDLLGVTSIVRALGLKEMCYDRILDSLHSRAIKLEKMTQMWTSIVLRLFPGIVTVNGRIVVVADGIKVPKRGKKMPAVKLLHQQSESNTKPQYIMGHSYQAISLLVSACKSVFAVPLASRIHEGIVLSNRDTRTLLDKMVSLLSSLAISQPLYFVADAYYASKKVINGLLQQRNHLVTQVRSNAVAYLPAEAAKGQGKKGRPKKYGKKLKLRSLFSDPNSMQTADSPVYGEKDVSIQFRCIDLLWRPVGITVRFVLVVHPTRARCILMCTDLSLDAIEIIRLYGLRFKIELSFKQAVRTIGAYAYHFWMSNMKPLKRRNGNQYLHRETQRYRENVMRKIGAYHLFVHVGIVAQGLLQYLSVCYPELIWRSFGSWIRTIRPGIPPSEMVTAMALRHAFPHFLLNTKTKSILAKFIVDRIDLNRSEGLRLVSR